jgi:hypothetical protein
MRERIFRDSIVTGVVIGLITIPVEYLLFYNFDKLINHFTEWGHVLKAPRLQSLILALNIILFRVIMINWKKAATGKGLLLVLLCFTGIYLYINKTSRF